MTFGDIKNRQAMRKITNAPLNKILGQDRAEQDIDWLIAKLDESQSLMFQAVLLMKEAALYIEQTEQSHDALTVDLISRMKQVLPN